MKTILLLFLTAGPVLYGQQQNRYLVSRESWQFYNPSVLPEQIYDNNNTWCGQLVANRTYTGLDGGPVHLGAILTHQLRNPQFYLGLKVLHDRTEGFSETDVSAHFLFRLKGRENDDNLDLATLAISSGFRSVKLNSDGLYYRDSGDPLEDAIFSGIEPDVSAGFFYFKREAVQVPFFAGISAQHIQGNSFSKYREFSFPTASRHLYIHGGCIFWKGNKFFQLQPMIWAAKVLKQRVLENSKYGYSKAPFSLDGLLRLYLLPKNALWIDLGYGTAASLRAGIGYKKDWFSFALALDTPPGNAFGPSYESNLGLGAGK